MITHVRSYQTIICCKNPNTIFVIKCMYFVAVRLLPPWQKWCSTLSISSIIILHTNVTAKQSWSVKLR